MRRERRCDHELPAGPGGADIPEFPAADAFVDERLQPLAGEAVRNHGGRAGKVFDIDPFELGEPRIDASVPGGECRFAVVAESVSRRMRIADLVDLFGKLRVVAMHELDRELVDASRCFVIGRRRAGREDYREQGDSSVGAGHDGLPG